MRKANKQASKCLSKALQDGQLQGMHASCNGKLFGESLGSQTSRVFGPETSPARPWVLSATRAHSWCVWVERSQQSGA